MALIIPNNCYFNQETLNLQNPCFRISPKSSLNLNHRHPHSQYPLHGKHRIRNQCFRVINELEDDSFKNNSHNDEEQGLGVKAALSMLSFYKREISPFLPKSCRYVPSCSEYSMIAYKKYGVTKGTILTAWRLCRCNPLVVVRRLQDPIDSTDKCEFLLEKIVGTCESCLSTSVFCFMNILQEDLALTPQDGSMSQSLQKSNQRSI